MPDLDRRRSGELGSLPAAPRNPSAVLFVLMAAAVLGIAGLAYWDAERESKASLEDFAAEQTTLALAVANGASVRLLTDEGVRQSDDGEPALRSGRATLRVPVGTAVARITIPTLGGSGSQEGYRAELRSTLILVLPPEGSELLTIDGRRVRSDALRAAFAAGLPVARLTRPEAAALGLPLRMAIAGIATIDGAKPHHDESAPGAGTDGAKPRRWGLAVVSSAARERDRERRAALRLVSSVGLAAGLVFSLGTMVLRRRRRALELGHQLEISELQRLRDERLVRASKVAMMGTFATGVAHEISTPLGVIAGRAEQLASRVKGDERAEKNVAIILQETTHIGEVIRGFLDLARGGRPTMTTIAPGELVEGAIRLVEHRFAKAGVRLESTIPDRLPDIQGDPRMLEHALVNLLLNACEACEEGGRVEIVTRAAPPDIAFEVLDDGSGITSENAARATEPFFTTKADGRGAGLGLAITHEILKSHRGALTIAPHAPRGTRATIEVPIVQDSV